MAGPRRNVRAFVSTMAFVLTSRAVGMFREVVISMGYGLSKATDTFYQLSALPTYTITFVTGPFSTAYIAWANRSTSPAESEHLEAVARGVLGAGLLAAALGGAGAFGYAFLTHAKPGFFLDAALITPSCAAVALIGLGSTVQNARGNFSKAQGLLFANNVIFVGLLALGAFLHGPTDISLIGAFTVASLIAAGLSARALGLGRGGPRLLGRWRDTPAPVRRSLVQEFLPQLGYASLETGGFIVTQAVVLVLASTSGAGVASAASLAARICLTANGLFVNPISNMIMVHLARQTAGRRRFVLLAVGATALSLGLVAAALAVSRGLLVHGLSVRGRFSADNARLLSSLIPSYGLWLVAQGTSMMLARLSFVLGRARLFTAVTVSGYALANLGRYLAWRAGGMPAAAATGAAVELAAAALVLLVLALRTPDAVAEAMSDAEAAAATALLAESVAGAEPATAPEPAAHAVTSRPAP